MLKYVALHSDGILMATYAAVSADLRDGTLVALEIPDQPLMFAEMGVVTLAGRTLSPAAAWLVQRMQEHADRLSAQFPPLRADHRKGAGKGAGKAARRPA